MRSDRSGGLRRRLLPLALAIAAGALGAAPGCGGDDDGAVADAAPSAPDGSEGCDPTAALPLQWRPIAMVSTGQVVTSSADGVTSASIDATAGGLAGAADNPYVYVDLAGAVKVDVDDTASYTSGNWDLAFKRASIRVDSGDSGSGQVTVATVAAASLAEVTAAPPDADFHADDWSSDDCVIAMTRSGEPLTAFGEWFDYDDATHVLTPKANVYVVKAHDGLLYKLRIQTYYGDSANPMRGGNYKLEWSAL
jgi:hypothetical protein